MILIDQLRRDESLRLTVYDDATGKPIVPGTLVKGHPTIGYGRALDVEGITKDEAEYLLSNDVSRVKIDVAEAIPWMTDLDEARRGVLQNMAFNMGVKGLLDFKNTLSLVKAGSYMNAATEMLNSKWAKQVGDRANHLARQMVSGEWQ